MRQARRTGKLTRFVVQLSQDLINIVDVSVSQASLDIRERLTSSDRPKGT